MKKLFLFLIWMASAGMAVAQSELPSDSVRRSPAANIKEYGGFLLDMGLMNVAPPTLPTLRPQLPEAGKDYNRLFRPDTNTIYSQGFSDAFSLSSPFGFGWGWGLSSSPQFMQKGTFQLKNGMRISTYGDYNKEGWRVPNHNALPWEKNNFRGAFELKSANGNFGVRIEVQQGRRGLY